MTKQQGFSLLGILLVVVVIAALSFGSIFFWQKNSVENHLETYNQAQKQIDDLKKTLDERNENLQAEINETKTDLATSDWQEYKKDIFNIRVKFHKDWYYERNNDLKYLFIGFAPTQLELQAGEPYPVEMIVAPVDLAPADDNYYIQKKVRAKDVVLIRTIYKENEDYKQIVDAMFASLADYQ